MRFNSETAGADDEQVQYWEMRVEGRLLDDVCHTVDRISEEIERFSFSPMRINTIKARQNGNSRRSSEV